jgi:hypothetical protein
MFNQSAIFFISKNYIILFSKNNSSQSLDIKACIANQEVLDPADYIKLVSDFIESLKIKTSKAYIAIDQTLTFEKYLDEPPTPEQQSQFASQLPFDPKQLSFATTTAENKNLLIATNKYIYQALVDVLETNKNQIELIFPARLISLTEPDANAANFENLFSKIKEIKNLSSFSFNVASTDQAEKTTLSVNKPTTPTFNKDLSQNQHKSKLLIYLLIIFAILAIVSAIYFVFLSSKSALTIKT